MATTIEEAEEKVVTTTPVWLAVTSTLGAATLQLQVVTVTTSAKIVEDLTESVSARRRVRKLVQEDLGSR